MKRRKSRSLVISVDGMTETFGRCIRMIEDGDADRISRSLDFGQGVRKVRIYKVGSEFFSSVRVEIINPFTQPNFKKEKKNGSKKASSVGETSKRRSAKGSAAAKLPE